MARYSRFVLKVPLNPKQTNKLHWKNHIIILIHQILHGPDSDIESPEVWEVVDVIIVNSSSAPRQVYNVLMRMLNLIRTCSVLAAAIRLVLCTGFLVYTHCFSSCCFERYCAVQCPSCLLCLLRHTSVALKYWNLCCEFVVTRNAFKRTQTPHVKLQESTNHMKLPFFITRRCA